MLFFPYAWHYVRTEIVVFGWSDEYVHTCLRVTGFKPFLYIRFPQQIQHDRIEQSIRDRFGKCVYSVQFIRRKALFSSALSDTEIFCFVSFQQDEYRRKCAWWCKETKQIYGHGRVRFECLEIKVTPELQWTCIQGISMADWFECKGSVVETNRLSLCPNEFQINWRDAFPPPPTVPLPTIPEPHILVYDIEAYSHDPKAFPNPKHPDDVVFQISCVIGSQSRPAKMILLALEPIDPTSIPESYIVQTFATEKQLLLAFKQTILDENPQFIMGYNTFGFDNDYLLERSKFHYIYDDFVAQGCSVDKALRKVVMWSSSAYNKQEMVFLDTMGRINMDMMTLVQRDHKLSSYRLDYVGNHFLKSGKDPVTVADIFLSWKWKHPTALAIIGKYCIQDSVLVYQLFHHLKYWYSLSSMSKICHIPLAKLIQQGQQIKIFCQIYKYCFSNHLILETTTDEQITGETIKGAQVLDAQPNIYENVVSVDFASLYPSILMAFNIDFTTLVRDDTLPDEQCHIIEWEEHENCSCPTSEVKKGKGVLCKKYRFRYLKEPRGVIPSILDGLVQARKDVRLEMKGLDETSDLYALLNTRQLAYKVSANSVYGALGVTTAGYFSFNYAAMSVTAKGRESLRKVKHLIEYRYSGKVVYGDTDSNHVVFPYIASAELAGFATRVAFEISKEFIDPMQLEFEKIYSKYLLLTKKRYIFYTEKGLDSKGVLLQRRDNPLLIRMLYKTLIEQVMDREPIHNLIDTLIQGIIGICCKSYPIDSFGISKSIKTLDDTVTEDQDQYKCGDYKLRSDTMDSLPGHARLALRMRGRGQAVENGSRFSYVVRKGTPQEKVGDRLEEIQFFKIRYQKSDLDALYYIQQLEPPIVELLALVMNNERKSKLLFQSLWKRVVVYERLLLEFKTYTSPTLRFIG